MSNLRDFQRTGEDLYVGHMNNTHSGNLSMKENRIMHISRTGAMLHRLEYSDIIETLIDGEDSNTIYASREIPVHRSIYKNTDAEAIVHAHPPCLIAISSKIDNVKPIDVEGAYYFKQGVPILSVENAIASDEVAAKITPLFRIAPIVIVKGHGTFSIGKDLEEALHWTSSLEHSAKILLFRNEFELNPKFT